MSSVRKLGCETHLSFQWGSLVFEADVSFLMKTWINFMWKLRCVSRSNFLMKSFWLTGGGRNMSLKTPENTLSTTNSIKIDGISWSFSEESCRGRCCLGLKLLWEFMTSNLRLPHEITIELRLGAVNSVVVDVLSVGCLVLFLKKS
jgi:hypothetical protein